MPRGDPNQVRLVKQVLVGKQWVKCKIASDSRNRYRWDYVLVKGRVEHHPEGVFQFDYRLDGRRINKTVGRDGPAALDAARRKRLELEALKEGILDAEQQATRAERPKRACKVSVSHRDECTMKSLLSIVED